MNLLDYIIIIIMIFLIIRGVLRGFVREIFALAGIVLGIWLGILFQPQVTRLLQSYLPNVQYLPLISTAILFIAIFISCNIMGLIIKFLFKKAFLGGLDRVLGALLAVTKGVFIIYILLIILTFFLPPRTPIIAGSRLAPWIIKSYQSVVGLISPDYYSNLKRKISKEKDKTGRIAPQIPKNMEKVHE